MQALKKKSSLSTDVTVNAGPRKRFSLECGPARLQAVSTLSPHDQDLVSYISPKSPGELRSREISAYMVTLGKSIVWRIFWTPSLLATQI